MTNGRAFSADEVASAWAAMGHKRLIAGIPIYSAVNAVHDYVVQSHGAFDETVLGLLRLKDKGQRVEVRVVLHAVTAPTRLRKMWVALSPHILFADHVAATRSHQHALKLVDAGFARGPPPFDYRGLILPAASR